MSKENKKEEHGFMSEAFGRSELFLEKRKSLLIGILVGIVVIVGGIYGYKTLILEPQEKEAAGQMFAAERYFEIDSLKKAIDGDGNNAGFRKITEDYSMTKSGNLAHYYLGMALLKKGEYENAIEALKDYKAADEITRPLAIGAMGDANMELGKTDEAIELYLKAAKENNKFSSPIFLKKAGLAYEAQSKFTEAAAVYKQIKSNYVGTVEANDMDKYIARASSMIK
jgi:tetratricopeptide (TPR) repeat protein